MTRTIRPRRLLTLAALTLGWCGLWGEVTFANVVAGLAVAIGITLAGVGTEGRGGIRPVQLMRLLWVIAADLVKSTISVAAEIITPTDRTDECIVAVNVAPESRHHLLLVIVAITLTPGTAVVDADPETGTLYLHLLHDSRRSETVEHVKKLARLACEALPVTKRTAIT